MPEQVVIDTPVEQPKQEIINPVIPDGMDVSKSIFNKEMEKVAAAQPEQPEPEPATAEPAAEPDPKPEQAAEPKSKIPQEILDGKKPETTVDPAIAEIDKMVLPKNAKQEQVVSFGKLKDHAKKTIEEKLARITELESKTSDGTTKAEIEAARARAEAAEKRAQELEENLNRTAFEKSATFQKRYVDSENAAVEGAKAYLEGTEVNPGLIELALRSQGAKRIAILKEGGVDSDLMAAIAPHLTNWDNIQRQKQEALDNWKAEAKAYEDQETQRSEQTKAQRLAEEESVWSAVIASAESDLLPLRKVQDNAEWNAQTDSIKNESKRIFNGEGVALDTLATTITKGVAYDVLHGMFTDVLDQLKAVKTENSKLKGARPAGSDTVAQPPAPKAKVDPTEAAKQSFREHLAAVQGTA